MIHVGLSLYSITKYMYEFVQMQSYDKNKLSRKGIITKFEGKE